MVTHHQYFCSVTDAVNCFVSQDERRRLDQRAFDEDVVVIDGSLPCKRVTCHTSWADIVGLRRYSKRRTTMAG